VTGCASRHGNSSSSGGGGSIICVIALMQPAGVNGVDDADYTLCLKKVSTFKLSVTLSNLNGFSKFLHCWKAYEIFYKTHTTIPTSP